MKTNLVNLVLGLAFTAGTVSCQSQKDNLVFEHQGDTVTIVHIAHPAKYLLLPNWKQAVRLILKWIFV